MSRTIDGILEIVRTLTAPETAWEALLALCEREKPSVTWAKLPRPAIDQDIAAATAWLSAQMAALATGRPGIYLGLDTLNMEERGEQYSPPKNVEIGFSSKGNPAQIDQKYIFTCDKYGADHLIASLRDMKRIYNRSDVSGKADYWLFLGYSGIVLLSAFERVPPENDFIAVWGFHDGDMFFLCRRTGGRYERLVHV
jgi:hypothetical protein